MKITACGLATLATAATLVLATQQVSAGSYLQQEQDRERMARDKQSTKNDRSREEFERQKWLADKKAEAAAEKRGDWTAAKNLAKWEDYRAKKYWDDRHQAGRDASRYVRDAGKCRRDGGC